MERVTANGQRKRDPSPIYGAEPMVSQWRALALGQENSCLKCNDLNICLFYV